MHRQATTLVDGRNLVCLRHARSPARLRRARQSLLGRLPRTLCVPPLGAHYVMDLIAWIHVPLLGATSSGLLIHEVDFHRPGSILAQSSFTSKDRAIEAMRCEQLGPETKQPRRPSILKYHPDPMHCLPRSSAWKVCAVWNRLRIFGPSADPMLNLTCLIWAKRLIQQRGRYHTDIQPNDDGAYTCSLPNYQEPEP